MRAILCLVITCALLIGAGPAPSADEAAEACASCCVTESAAQPADDCCSSEQVPEDAPCDGSSCDCSCCFHHAPGSLLVLLPSAPLVSAAAPEVGNACVESDVLQELAPAAIFHPPRL